MAANDPVPAVSDLDEDSALSLLNQSDVSVEVLQQLSKHPLAAKNRKFRIALAGHPKTPRQISIPLIRQLFTFDLMDLALTPVVPGDIKKVAEELLIKRLDAISSGERLSLARRASGDVAGELLLDTETRVMKAALENARLTEAHVIRALTRENPSAALVRSVCLHEKWSLRREVRMALLRSQKTPLEAALTFARELPPKTVREILENSRLPAGIKAAVLEEMAERT